MLRLCLFLIALAGFAALVARPEISPRATRAADDRAARVYADAPPSIVARPPRAPIDPAVVLGEFLSGYLHPEEAQDADDLLTITTADGEVIRVATQIRPGRIGPALVRIAAEDRNAEARRLEEANARARAAVAERAATAIAADATDETAPAELVYATGAYINLRSGPSTAYPVVGFMNFGMAAERQEALPGGWSRIRVLETGAEGFMFSAYLSDRAP